MKSTSEQLSAGYLQTIIQIYLFDIDRIVEIIFLENLLFDSE